MPGESQKEPSTGQADPSVLTTEALQREIGVIRDEIGMRVQGLADVVNEKFDSVKDRDLIRSEQRVEQKKDTKDAVDAALSAAKEAVQEQTKASAEAIGKSEALTANSMAQLETTINTGIATVTDKVDDLKDRIVRIEQQRLTEANGHDQSRLDIGLLVSLGSFFVAIIAVVIVVLIR